MEMFVYQDINEKNDGFFYGYERSFAVASARVFPFNIGNLQYFMTTEVSMAISKAHEMFRSYDSVK